MHNRHLLGARALPVRVLQTPFQFDADGIPQIERPASHLQIW
jgi:hypothetical protein